MKINFEKLKVYESQNANNSMALSTVNNFIAIVSTWNGNGPMPANVAMAAESLRSIGILDSVGPQQLNS